MLKKLFLLYLSFVLSVCCSSRIALAQTTDYGLSQAILYVKNTLDIPYDFINLDISSSDYGSCKKWNLSWHGLNNNVSICVTSNNTILSYHSNSSTPGVDSSFSFSPTLSKEQYNACMSQATIFLNKILRDNESFYFYNLPKTFPTTSRNPTFTGAIKINNVDSIFDFSITVNLQNGNVISFFRDEFLGINNKPIPNSTPNIDSTHAKFTFSSELPVKNIEYILNPNDPSDTVAKLVYTIPDCHLHYVNAHSGQLLHYNNYYPICRDNLVDDVYLTSKTRGELENTLTEVELNAIAKMTDVLSKTELDSILKQQKELGLSKYIISQSSYHRNIDSKDLLCTLTYTSDDDLKSLGLTSSDNSTNTTITKSITVNAKTGDILSLYTSYPYRNSPTVDVTYDSDYHTDFLKNTKNYLFSKTRLVNSSKNSFEYVQVENNYLFRQNYVTVHVNNYTGLVDGFNQNWNDSITFENPENIISPDEATNILYNNSNAKLYYITEIFSKKETLLLAYLLEYPKAAGISAKDGSFISYTVNFKDPFTYSDTDNCYARDTLFILGEHGVGFDHSNLFNPSAKVTQLDALILFANSLGYSFDSDNISLYDFKTIYNIAYTYNIIVPFQKEPLRPISRCEFVKMLLYHDYNYISNLKNPKNILRCSFIDCNDIPDNYFTYVCIAQGLGLIVGDGNLNFNPYDTITRLDACNILYNFMKFNTNN